MTFKLMQSAEKRWIKIRGFHHLDNVIRGVKFKDGRLEKESKTATASYLTENLNDRAAAQ